MSNKMVKTVTSTAFQQAVGVYMEASAKAPVFITKHATPVRVLIDIDEYHRLKERDTRQALRVSELSDSDYEGIKNAEYGAVDPGLERLME